MMKEKIQPGDVWIVDLGIAAKVRPVLVLTPEPIDTEQVLFTFVQHTTSVQEGNPWQVRVPKPWLHEGAFHLQNINSVSRARFVRKLGALTVDEFDMLKSRLRERLGL